MTQTVDLNFVESQMYSAIRNLTLSEQAELRALSASQSLPVFTRTLQQRFSQHAKYITEERVRNVMDYDRQQQTQMPAISQAHPAIVPASQPVPLAQATPKVVREEMWWITLAKSKIMRFFAVSCEFIIFIGCLWLTLVTILPDATNWFDGSVDKFFLVAMGFAVDAALPEAWLHVVDQYTESPRKKSQLKWSIPIAIGMLILVIANIVYTKLAGTTSTQPTGPLAALVDTLLIARMFIGISYVTIRECQSFIDRKYMNQHMQTRIHQQMQADVNQQILVEVKNVHQQTLSEVRCLLGETNQHQQQQVAMLAGQLRQEIHTQMIDALGTLTNHSSTMLDEAVGRIERANSRRLDAFYTKIEQVAITLESNPSLPAIPASSPRSQFQRIPGRTSTPVRIAPTNVSDEAADGQIADVESSDTIDWRQMIANKMSELPFASSQQMADAVGCSRSTAGKWLKVLREEGVLVNARAN